VLPGKGGVLLIVRWTGKTWSQLPAPTEPGGQLSAVAAASTGSAWAVGYSGVPAQNTLILHWNGKTWS
jgi:photosystem II stability/assembly factor-like uncharacterized protein